MNAFKKELFSTTAYSYYNFNKNNEVIILHFKDDKELVSIEIEDYYDTDWGEEISFVEFNNKFVEAKKQIQNLKL